MKIAICVGEPSGDLIAAKLIQSLLDKVPNVEIYGIAGPRMRQLPIKTIAPMEKICVFGIFEVLKHLPRLLRIRAQFKRYLKENPPDIFIGVDAPDFNLPIEKYLKNKLRIKTVHYNSPTVWAWRKKRVYQIAQATDLLLCLFPFEPQYYAGLPIEAHYIGHPLADELAQTVSKAQARKSLNLDLYSPMVALLPGSRSSEITNHAQLFIKTASLCWQKNQQLTFLLSAIHEKAALQLAEILACSAPTLPIKIIVGKSHAVMQAADTVLLASGTATLEVMLIEQPMVVAYKISPLTYWLAKKLVKIPYYSLPNILANEKIVPEFIQDAATAKNLAQALLATLANDQSEKQKKYAEISFSLRKNATEIAANKIIDFINK